MAKQSKANRPDRPTASQKSEPQAPDQEAKGATATAEKPERKPRFETIPTESLDISSVSVSLKPETVATTMPVCIATAQWGGKPKNGTTTRQVANLIVALGTKLGCGLNDPKSRFPLHVHEDNGRIVFEVGCRVNGDLAPKVDQTSGSCPGHRPEFKERDNIGNTIAHNISGLIESGLGSKGRMKVETKRERVIHNPFPCTDAPKPVRKAPEKKAKSPESKEDRPTA